MNYDDIQNLWGSPDNRPSPEDVENEGQKFVAHLRGRRRSFLLFSAITFVALFVITARIILHLLWLDPGHDAIDLSREWGLIPFIAAPWIGWILLMRQYRRYRARHPDYTRSIQAGVRALLDENRFERTRYKIIVVLQAATLMLIPLVVHQLRAVEKAGDEVMVPAFVVFPMLMLAIAAGSTWRYRRKLLPRKEHLERILASYET